MKYSAIIFSAMFSILIFAMDPLVTTAASSQPDLYKAKATAYCLPGKTASGCEVREGICAGPSEWIGKTIILYQRLPGDRVGDMVGIYECLDKGGTEAITNGDVIDIWQKDLSECDEFMELLYSNNCKGNVYIQILDAVGQEDW